MLIFLSLGVIFLNPIWIFIRLIMRVLSAYIPIQIKCNLVRKYNIINKIVFSIILPHHILAEFISSVKFIFSYFISALTNPRTVQCGFPISFFCLSLTCQNYLYSCSVLLTRRLCSRSMIWVHFIQQYTYLLGPHPVANTKH